MSVFHQNILAGASGAGEGAAAEGTYVDDIFSTFLYEGNEATRDIVNGIDLSTEGGMVMIINRKSSSTSIDRTNLFDTERGATKKFEIENSNAETTDANSLTAFNTNGFSLGNSSSVNESASGSNNYVAWTFRKEPGFFDVVTYTGNGTAGRTVAHNLGSVPGMIIVKRIDASGSHIVFHRSEGNTEYAALDLDARFASSVSAWNNTDPTSTDFTVGNSTAVNANGGTYVAYLFAHDDASFGLNSDESVIKCGEYTGNGSSTGPVVDLGFEPQWIMIKRSSGDDSWTVSDVMRGINYRDAGSFYYVLDAAAPESSGQQLTLLPNGFQITSADATFNRSGSTFIYVAIRRPHKAPTAGTEIFKPNARAGVGVPAGPTPVDIDLDFNPDVALIKRRTLNTSDDWLFFARHMRPTYNLHTSNSEAKNTDTDLLDFLRERDSRVRILSSENEINRANSNYIDYFFKRSAQAIDTVFYTGDGVAGNTVTHNLAAVPELILVKRTNFATSWAVYSSVTGNTKVLRLNTAAESTSSTHWNDTTPTSSVFTVGTSTDVNASAGEYFAMLFASVDGVIDIGSYTGTGTAGLQVDCGFTAGARLVWIKRTDAAGDGWHTFDTARGIVAGNDPALRISSSVAEGNTGNELDDYIDPHNPGFEIATTDASMNASGGTYLYMAIA